MNFVLLESEQVQSLAKQIREKYASNHELNEQRASDIADVLMGVGVSKALKTAKAGTVADNAIPYD